MAGIETSCCGVDLFFTNHLFLTYFYAPNIFNSTAIQATHIHTSTSLGNAVHVLQSRRFGHNSVLPVSFPNESGKIGGTWSNKENMW